MPASLDLQIEVDNPQLPDVADFQLWLSNTLQSEERQGEITVRIVDADEIQQLNRDYRDKDKPTNVLSFPFELPPGLPPGSINILGDLVICDTVVEAEAKQQNKTLQAHWAHMVTHGCLHLLGYDHIKEHEASLMEGKEIKLLKELGYANPYIQD